MIRKLAVWISLMFLVGTLAARAGIPPKPTPRKGQPAPRKGLPTPRPKTPTPTPSTGFAPTPPKPPSPGNHLYAVRVDELDRRYVVHVPARYDGIAPTPLVIILHGEGSTATNCMRETGWAIKSDLAGFLAAFPEAMTPDPTKPARYFGNPQTWNDGSGRFTRGLEEVDDIGFIEAMLDDMRDQYNVDKRRVYVTGFSNGASMAFQLGVELSDRIAAIAPVAGYLWLKNPKLENPVSVLYIVGTADPLVPLKGGEVRLPGGRVETRPPVTGSPAGWAKALGCPLEPKPLRTKEGVSAVVYGPGREGSEVVFYTVEGLGHTWPGGKRLLPERIAGPTTDKLRANDVIWEFFHKHVKGE